MEETEKEINKYSYDKVTTGQETNNNISKSTDSNNFINNHKTNKIESLNLDDLQTSPNSLLTGKNSKNYLVINDSIKKKLMEGKLTLGIGTYIVLLSIFYVIFTLRLYELNLFSLSEYPIKYKSQYYRMLSHHFVHLNFVHFLVVISFIYYLLDGIEKKIGTLVFSIYCSLSLFFVSLAYYLLIKISKFLINDCFNIKDVGFDFYATVGSTGIFFCFYYIYCLDINNPTVYYYQYDLEMLKILKPYCLLIILQFLNPKTNFYGHVSGIIAAKFIIRFSKILFPSIEIIYAFENKNAAIISRFFLNWNYIPCKILLNNNILINLNLKVGGIQEMEKEVELANLSNSGSSSDLENKTNSSENKQNDSNNLANLNNI